MVTQKADDHPEITIFIPLYNGIEFLETSLKSVLNQTYSNWKLIIGVNGYPEGSDVFNQAKDLVNNLNRIQVLDLYWIKGKVKAMQEMLKYTTSEWIALLDVDDYWTLDKLAEQIKYIDRYDIIGTKAQYFDLMNDIPLLPVGDITNFDFLQINPLINSSILIKKKLCLWRDIHLEDYDLWLKLRFLNYRFYNIDKILTFHRIHPNSAFNAQGNNNHVAVLKNRYATNSLIIII